MKVFTCIIFSFILLFLFSAGAISQNSKNIQLLDNWFQDSLLTSNAYKVRFSDCFGFVANGKEYGIIGSTEGSHFFELSDANKLVSKGTIQGKYQSALVVHREYAKYKNYIYAVCDEGSSSLQIIDISNIDYSISVVKEDSVIFGQVHNIFIDTNNALMYCCIFTPYIGNPGQLYSPMKVYSILDPLNPIEVWDGPSDIDEVHDIYVRDNKAFLNCGFEGLRVYDFTNPSAPVFKSSLSLYQEQGYNHQGWLSPDGTTYYFGDETSGKKIKKCSVSNWNVTVTNYFGTNFTNMSVPHNMKCTNEFLFCAYYNEGLRIYDVRDGFPIEIAFYDTYPDNSSYKLNGAWGVYSDLPSGRILVSDRQYGLFLLDFNRDLFLHELNGQQVQLFPNPIHSGEEFSVVINDKNVNGLTLRLYDYSGKIVTTISSANQNYYTGKLDVAKGLYSIRISYFDKNNTEIIDVQKLIVL
jgi:choice-of-anchor B domain-containing protein